MNDMRIRNNQPGTTALRSKRTNNSNTAKNLEKLSTGLRINRSADDAAGLAISEKLRAQITGLAQAIDNSKQGINLIQIAEGGMSELHSMLNRMVELADQSMNGTYDDNVDRVQLDKEYKNLIQEIDRISEATSYGTIKLLDGSLQRDRITEVMEMGVDWSRYSLSSYIRGEVELPAGYVPPKKPKLVAFDSSGNVVDVVSQDARTEVEDLKRKARVNGVAEPTPVTGGNAGLFQVDGGVEGTDWEYDAAAKTLKILNSCTANSMTISGGFDGAGNFGRIVVEDGAAAAASQANPLELKLSGVRCEVADGPALKVGENNNVKLTLVDGKENTFRSGRGYAGISVGEDSNLTIEGENNSNNAYLYAIGGKGGAGIGMDDDAGRSNPHNSITINSGYICAFGGLGAAGIGGGNDSAVGDIKITGGLITAMSEGHGAGIGGGWTSGNSGDITIEGPGGAGTPPRIIAMSTYHGTGIGAGCGCGHRSFSGNITIKNAEVTAYGGDSGAGIGSSWEGECGDIAIEGNSRVTAIGGDQGAGIGAGSDGSIAGNITINVNVDATDPEKYGVKAEGGEAGVGIGSGYCRSSCGDIEIQQGVISARGYLDSTGIGAGLQSTSGDITIGVAGLDNPVIVDAWGGLTDNGGNIETYRDSAHTVKGTLTITGNKTTARPGVYGEGIYSTSGARDENGNSIYAYPVYLLLDPNATADNPPLAGWNAGETRTFPPPDGCTGQIPLPSVQDLKITATGVTSGISKTWPADPINQPLSHQPLNENYDFIWMTGEDQTLEISYTDGGGTTQTTTLALKFLLAHGIFRLPDQPEPPEPPVKPGPHIEWTLITDDVVEGRVWMKKKKAVNSGLRLHIGETAEPYDFLTVYIDDMHAKAMGVGGTNIRSQDSADKALTACRRAINYVSSSRGDMGAYHNRLEHNINALGVAHENITQAESQIRDTDMADEMIQYTKNNILSQSSQAMLAQAQQLPQGVLQLLGQ